MSSGSPPTGSTAPSSSRPNRRKLQQSLEIEWGSSRLTGQVQDIGLSGMFVRLTPPLWLGATFTARLLVTPPLELHCTVCRVEPDAGFAVTFQLPNQSAQSQLEALLASLPAL